MRTLDERMQNELVINTNRVRGRGDRESIWMRFLDMTNKATTGSVLAKITLVIATVGICFQVAYIFIPYFSNQDKRMALLEQQREADHKLVITTVQNVNQFLNNSIEVRKEEIDASKLPKAKKEEMKAKLVKGVTITGANGETYADQGIPGENRGGK